MKRWFKYLIIFFLPLSAFAQNFGNEWINYSDRYLKFPVVRDGVHKIDYTTFSAGLQKVGVSISAIDPYKIRIFGRGKEIPLYVAGQADQNFNTTDYIAFYGKRNDGWLDTAVYDEPDNVVNPYYSLFNDTAWYFITWTGSIGKRVNLTNFTNHSDYTAPAYFLRDTVTYFNNYYNSISEDPFYTQEDGWGDAPIQVSSGSPGTASRSVSAPFLYSGADAPAAVLKTHVYGASQNDHHLQLEFTSDFTNYSVLLDEFFNGLALKKYSFNIANSSLSNQNGIRYTTLPVPGSTGRLAFSFVAFTYPHTLNLENRTSMLVGVPGTALPRYRFDFSAINNAGGNVFCMDITDENNVSAAFAIAGAGYSVLLPSFGPTDKKLAIVAENAMLTPGALIPAGNSGFFTDYTASTYDYLMITHKSLMSSASSYKAHRQSVAGGSFKPLLVTVDEIYDQFAYGIKKNPLAIRNFVNYAVTWSTKPKYLFLIGKGAYSDFIRQNAANYAKNLVPTMGYPPSDIAMTLSKDSLYTPLIPVGRIAVKSDAELYNYLKKVQDHENAKDDPSDIATHDWRKQVLHFGGGSNSQEQEMFSSFLNVYQNIVEGPKFGGNVHTFLKTSPAPIQGDISSEIKRLIDNGVGVMNFFGHASGTSFDVSIDDPQSYSNYQKYPLILANSCFVGDIHQSASLSATGTSETFVLAENRGAIAFIAQVGLGYAGELFEYNREFLDQLFRKNYGKSYSEAMQSTIRTIQNGQSFLRRGSCLGMTLHGDPYLGPLVQPKPDIALHSQNISFLPSVVTAETDSVIRMNIILTNLGQTLEQPFALHIKRTFPDNTTDSVLVAVPFLHYQDTVTVSFPVNRVKAAGMNFFSAYADFSREIDEMNENNNEVTVPLYIKSSSIVPVYPYIFSIVPRDSITLKAATGDPFAPSTRYRFELDTTQLFNSPFKRTMLVTQTGGIVPAPFNSWQNSSGMNAPFLMNQLGDSVVYYWRVSVDTAGTSSTALWKESSFQFIRKRRGWEQAHVYQFSNDSYNFLDLDEQQRRYNFLSNQRHLSVKSIADPSLIDLYDTYYKLDAELIAAGGCNPGTAIHVAVLDSTTLEPWKTDNYNFDNTNTPGSGCNVGNRMFIFHLSHADEMQGLSRMLDSIPNGHYFLAYSFLFRPNDVPVWADPTVKQKLTAMGFNNIASVPLDLPFVLFVKKGTPSSKKEVYGSSNTSTVTFDTTLVNSRTFGEISSPVIGPSLRWDSLYYELKTGESNGDVVEVQVIGISSTGAETVLIRENSFRDSSSLSSISATDYPFLRLKAIMRDSINNTPLQLKRWHVVYAQVPEAAVNPARGYTIAPASPQEGETFTLKVAVENIGDLPMDSMAVTGFVRNKDLQQIQLPVKKYKKLAPGEYVNAEVSFNTKGYSGNNLFWFEANPLIPGTSTYFQPEQYHFNNLAHLQLNVSADRENPLLDVTFDGVHILNGDIVSAKPEILIQVKDENKFLLLDTSSFVQVFVKFPGEETEVLIPFDNNTLRFVKASGPNNKCKVEYHPSFTVDGKYELRVRAQDASRNESGHVDYIINFEVINKSMITEVMNYPNPFSTSTRFVFTLTGSVLPQYFKIQIMTITGKVVREINLDELGMIRIGRNITDYAWDGRDQYGDQLANGIYFYRVVTRIEGEKIEHMQTAADQYFHKGLGKMYLMR